MDDYYECTSIALYNIYAIFLPKPDYYANGITPWLEYRSLKHKLINFIFGDFERICHEWSPLIK